jgi:apolipoprotein N-acyltransferase
MPLAPTQACVFALSSAGLLLLSFPPLEYSWLVWCALVPLFIALHRLPLLNAFLSSALFGLVGFAGMFYWVWTSASFFSIAEYLMFALYFSCWTALFGCGAVWLTKRSPSPPAVLLACWWVSLEFLRSHASVLSPPWMLIGHSQYRHPIILQICSLTGVYGVSFLIVLVNAVLAESARTLVSRSAGSRRLAAVNLRQCVVTGVIVAATLAYGYVRLPAEVAADHITVSTIQPNIPPVSSPLRSDRDAILDQAIGLSRRASRDHPALIVWPETAVPGDVLHEPALQARISAEARAQGTFLLVGSAEHAKFTDRALYDKRFNTMVLFNPDGALAGFYRKMVLVPFGEYQPWDGPFRVPAMLMTIENFMKGADYTLFNANSVTFGVTICWENIFSDHVREFVRRGAQFMVNATNEAWFGRTAAPAEFLMMSVFRAVENRVAIVRAANSGISAIIDPYGLITAVLSEGGEPLFVTGTMTGRVPVSGTHTFYTYYGDVFACANVAVCLLWLVYGYCLRPLPHLYRRGGGLWIKGEGT